MEEEVEGEEEAAPFLVDLVEVHSEVLHVALLVRRSKRLNLIMVGEMVQSELAAAAVLGDHQLLVLRVLQ